MITARAVATSDPIADLSDVTGDFSYSTLPQSIYDQLTSDWGNYSTPSPEQLASESKAFAQFTSDFYKSASPSELSAIAAANAEASAIDAGAGLFNDQGPTLSPSQSAALANLYNDWTATAAQGASATGKGASATSNSAASQTPSPANAFAAPLPLANTPGADSILCVKQTGLDGGTDTVNTTACATAIQNACRKLDQSKTGDYLFDEWIWSGGSEADNGLSNTLGCSVGYWLPKSVVNRDKSTPNPLVPSRQECETSIYNVMVSQCLQSTNAAAINVAQLPDPKNKDNSGQQVDAGKVSYLLAPQPWPCNEGYNCFH